MKKITLRSALALLFAVVMMMTFASCVGEGSTETEPYIEETPEKESVSEWETEPEETIEEYKKCEHVYKNGYCSRCGEKGGATENLHFLANGDGTWRVSGVGECTYIHIIIPLMAPNGEPITKIGYRAFAWYETMETIVIHKNITVIDSSAFHDCLSLQWAEFDDPDGWYCNGVPVDFSDPRKNVSILLSGEKFEKR